MHSKSLIIFDKVIEHCRLKIRTMAEKEKLAEPVATATFASLSGSSARILGTSLTLEFGKGCCYFIENRIACLFGGRSLKNLKK